MLIDCVKLGNLELAVVGGRESLQGEVGVESERNIEKIYVPELMPQKGTMPRLVVFVPFRVPTSLQLRWRAPPGILLRV